jgi:hypothetical protein
MSIIVGEFIPIEVGLISSRQLLISISRFAKSISAGHWGAVLNLFDILIGSALVVLFPTFSQAGMVYNYHGRLLNADGVTPVAGSSIQFQVQITEPNAASCVLYAESQSISVDANGYFSLPIGAVTATVHTTSSILAQAFANGILPIQCFNAVFAPISGQYYSPSPGDGRVKFLILVDRVDSAV